MSSSSSLHQTLSVAEYIKKTDLSNLINAAVNACAAHRPHPSLVPAFLSQHFHAQHFESPAAVAIDGISLALCGLDGAGTPQLELSLSLMDGRSASALVAHSCGMASVHPSSSRINRRSTFDVRQRSHRAKAVRDVILLSNNSSSTDAQQQQQQLGNKIISILCNAICGSCALLPTNGCRSGIASNVITGVSAGSGEGSASISAAKPLRDFDLVLASADGSTNFSVLGSNIAAAASIAFCKLRSQVHRTPLGLGQPLYKLLAKDFAFLEANSTSNTAQLVSGSEGGGGGGSSAGVFSSPLPSNVNNGNNNNSNNTAGSTQQQETSLVSGSSNNNNNNNITKSLFSVPLPLIPLFSASDAPVFGKLRILKQVVIFPNPKIYFSADHAQQKRGSNDVGKVVHELQQVVNVCYEKLTTDEATQQPPIMLPHHGGVMKHAALETLSAVVEFVEECIKEALPQYFPPTLLQQLAQQQQAAQQQNAQNAQTMLQQQVASMKSNTNTNSKQQQQQQLQQQQQDGSSISDQPQQQQQQQQQQLASQQQLQPQLALHPTGLPSDISPILIGLILDGSACSMRGNSQQQPPGSDDFYFGATGHDDQQARGSPSNARKSAAATAGAAGAGATTAGGGLGGGNRNPASSPANKKATAHADVAGADHVPTSSSHFGGATKEQISQPPPKYVVVDGAPEWTAAQLTDHLAALCATKPLVKYIQDSHREDQGGPTGEFMNDSWRRLMSRMAHLRNYTAPPSSDGSNNINISNNSNNNNISSNSGTGTSNTPQDISIAGDELFCSNQSVIERLAPEAVCNTLVVRIVDAGTVTRAMNCARCFASIVPAGSVCVSPEVCDNEAARPGGSFPVDFAFAIRAKFLYLNSSTISAAGCQGAAMLTRYQEIINELEVTIAEKKAASESSGIGPSSPTTSSFDRILSYPFSLPDYSAFGGIRNLASEPVEPLTPLEGPVGKDVKKKR